VAATTTPLELDDLAGVGLLGMVLAASPVAEAVASTHLSNYGPLAHCATTACGPATAAILARAAAHGALVVIDASLPGSLEAHSDAFYLEAKALTAIEAMPFPSPAPRAPPPPPFCKIPPPPPPAPGAANCYKLGTWVCGMCNVFGKGPYESHATPALRVSCVPSLRFRPPETFLDLNIPGGPKEYFLHELNIAHSTSWGPPGARRSRAQVRAWHLRRGLPGGREPAGGFRRGHRRPLPRHRPDLR
jgi:hypothetical protein